MLANLLPAFSLPALPIFLSFPRFSLFFTYRNAQQLTAISRRLLGVKHSQNNQSCARCVRHWAKKTTKVQPEMLQTQRRQRKHFLCVDAIAFDAAFSPFFRRRHGNLEKPQPRQSKKDV